MTTFSKEKCNAPEIVAELLKETEIPETVFNGTCRALASALTLIKDAEKQQAMLQEFIAIAGGSDCARLKGLRCPYYCELAAALAVKYRRNSDPNGKIKVMLIGDSIRGLYQNRVSEELGEDYEVVFPSENSRFAKFALNMLPLWFKECGAPDIIHWNIGLWDSAVVCDEDGMFTCPEEYLFYMSRIQRELEKHCKKVVFATTTPVRDGSLNQHIEYIDQLNATIVPWMKEHNVPVNDLYAFIKPHMDEFLGPDCIHLSQKGIESCGKEIADVIRKHTAK